MVPNRQDIPEALNHVLYEMEMMHEAADLIKHHPKGTVIHNAALESFIVHARCLEEFFCKAESNNPNDDTMHPHHFVSFRKQAGSDLYKRMHKEIAHLTYARKRPGEIRPWSIGQLTGTVAAWSVPFLKAVLAVDSLMEFQNNRIRVLRQLDLFQQVLQRREDTKLRVFSGTSATTSATTAYVGPVVPE